MPTSTEIISVYSFLSEGPEVAKIQNRLMNFFIHRLPSQLDFYFPDGSLGITNIYDELIVSAVKDFQHYITFNFDPTFVATGEAGPKTQTYLKLDWGNKSDEELQREPLPVGRIIKGRIIDSNQNQPIKGVRVRMKLDPNNDLLSISNEDGGFELQLSDNIIFYQGIFPTPPKFQPIELRDSTVISTVELGSIGTGSLEEVEFSSTPNSFSGFYTDQPPNPSFENDVPNAIYNTTKVQMEVNTYGKEREKQINNLSSEGYYISTSKILEFTTKEEGNGYVIELKYPQVNTDRDGSIQEILPSKVALKSKRYTKDEFIEESTPGGVYRIRGSSNLITNKPKSKIKSLPEGLKIGDIIMAETPFGIFTLRYVVDTDNIVKKLPTIIRNAKEYVDRSNTGQLHQHYKWLIKKNGLEKKFKNNLTDYVNMQSDTTKFPTDYNDPDQKKSKDQIKNLINDGNLDLLINFMLQVDTREKSVNLGIRTSTNSTTGISKMNTKAASEWNQGLIAKVLYPGLKGKLNISEDVITEDQLQNIRNYEPPTEKNLGTIPPLQQFLNDINDGNTQYEDKGKFNVVELIYGPPQQIFPNIQLNFISPSLRNVMSSPEWGVLTKGAQNEIKNKTNINITGKKLAKVPVLIDDKLIEEQRDYVLNKQNIKNSSIASDEISPIKSNGEWVWNLGDISMVVNDPKLGLDEVERKKYIINDFVGKDGDKTLQDSILRKDIKNTIVDTIDATIMKVKEKLLQTLYDQLAEFGIKDPSFIIKTLREFQDVIDTTAEDLENNPENNNNTPNYDPYQSNSDDASTIGEFITGSLIGRLEGRTEGTITSTINTGENIVDISKELLNKDNPTTIKQIDTKIVVLEEQIELVSSMDEGMVNLGYITRDRDEILVALNEELKELKERKNIIQNFKKDIGVQIKILVQRGLLNFPKICPKKGGTLDQIVIIRNNLSSQINKMQKVLNGTFDTIDIFDKVITAYQQLKLVIITTYAALPLPLSTATAGVVSTLQDAKDILMDKNDVAIDKMKNKIEPALKILPIAIGVLNQIDSYMKLLDYLIEDCAEESNLKSGTFNLTPLLIASKQKQTIEDENPVVKEYKGFTFEVKEEVSNKEVKRRYAQALNAAGNISLVGSPSYSSNEQILINELIYQIELNKMVAI